MGLDTVRVCCWCVSGTRCVYYHSSTPTHRQQLLVQTPQHATIPTCPSVCALPHPQAALWLIAAGNGLASLLVTHEGGWQEEGSFAKGTTVTAVVSLGAVCAAVTESGELLVWHGAHGAAQVLDVHARGVVACGERLIVWGHDHNCVMLSNVVLQERFLGRE